MVVIAHFNQLYRWRVLFRSDRYKFLSFFFLSSCSPGQICRASRGSHLSLTSHGRRIVISCHDSTSWKKDELSCSPKAAPHKVGGVEVQRVLSRRKWWSAEGFYAWEVVLSEYPESSQSADRASICYYERQVSAMCWKLKSLIWQDVAVATATDGLLNRPSGHRTIQDPLRVVCLNASSCNNHKVMQIDDTETQNSYKESQNDYKETVLLVWVSFSTFWRGEGPSACLPPVASQFLHCDSLLLKKNVLDFLYFDYQDQKQPCRTRQCPAPECSLFLCASDWATMLKWVTYFGIKNMDTIHFIAKSDDWMCVQPVCLDLELASSNFFGFVAITLP